MSESFLDDSPFSSQKMMNFFHDNDQIYTNVAELKVKNKKRKNMCKNLPPQPSLPPNECFSSSLSHLNAENTSGSMITCKEINKNSSRLIFVDEQSPIVMR
jgi:hypothetical protein